MFGRSLNRVARAAWRATAGPLEKARLDTGSGWAAGLALLTCPTERVLQLSDQDYRLALYERLGVPRCGDGVCGFRFSTGGTCRYTLREGWHAHCCRGAAGVRILGLHNPLAQEWCRFLVAAGRFARTEQRDPTMGPTARLDVVELASAAGGAAAYDVSVVTPFRADAGFTERCAAQPGLAAQLRHDHKLHAQYAARLPGARLVPLVAETGGRWHPSVPSLARRLAREYVQRAPGLPGEALSVVVARWAARLSALLIRGNGIVARHVLPAGATVPPPPAGGGGLARLPHCLPEGDSAYELLVS